MHVHTYVSDMLRLHNIEVDTYVFLLVGSATMLAGGF